jgi:hypothetical protein
MSRRLPEEIEPWAEIGWHEGGGIGYVGTKGLGITSAEHIATLSIML